MSVDVQSSYFILSNNDNMYFIFCHLVFVSQVYHMTISVPKAVCRKEIMNKSHLQSKIRVYQST